MTGKVSPQSFSLPEDSVHGTVREKLQGWIPRLAGPEEIRSALDKAFDYRGDVTITLLNGNVVEGYVFDRRSESPDLRDCRVRVFPSTGQGRISIPYSEIARLEFTGRDTAAGRSFELWVRKYQERKARGEKNISLDPDPLD
jgi:hypothetical protein